MDRSPVRGRLRWRQPDEDCQREVLITFLTLETFELGSDQEEDFLGDVGPVYGYFYGNEQQVTFSGGNALSMGLDFPADSATTARTTSGICRTTTEWQFSDNPEVLVPLPPDAGSLQDRVSH